MQRLNRCWPASTPSLYRRRRNDATVFTSAMSPLRSLNDRVRQVPLEPSDRCCQDIKLQYRIPRCPMICIDITSNDTVVLRWYRCFRSASKSTSKPFSLFTRPCMATKKQNASLLLAVTRPPIHHTDEQVSLAGTSPLHVREENEVGAARSTDLLGQAQSKGPLQCDSLLHRR